MQAGKEFKSFLSKRRVAFGSICLIYLWLFFAATSPKLPTSHSPLCFYSNQCQQDLSLLLSTAIQKAEKSIYLQMYALTDKKILFRLKKKAEEGIPITLFYDPTASLDIPKILDPSIAFPVVTDGLMHRKILIIDNKIVFLGSANMTEQSLKMHDNIMLGVYHEPLAQFIESSTSPQYPFSIAGQEAELWLLPDKEDKALQRLLSLIENSKKNIKIAMFTFTHPLLAEALIQAQKKGVNVSLAVDYYTAKGASAKALARLKDEGIQLYLSRGQQLLHHKWASFDDDIVVAGSANWTRSAFSRNQDCFMILSTLTRDQRKFMNKMWKTITLESQKS